jgi:coenzyme F420-reducing hydrogenase delta subunit
MSIDKAFRIKTSLLVNTSSSGVSLDVNSTDAIQISVGTSGERPSGANGMFRYNSTTGNFEGYIASAWTAISDATGTGDMSTSTYDPAAISEQLVGLTATQTLTNKTFTTATITTPAMGAGSVDAIGEIASAIRSGADTRLVTGTATGTNGDLAVWNVTGDIADGPTPPTGTIVGTTDSQTLTSKTLTSPTINTPNMGAGSVDAITEIAAAIRSGADTRLVTGTATGTNGDLATWNVTGDIADGPTPPTGTIVGTTDAQTLTNKTFTSPTINSPNLGASSINAITEIASGIKTGTDGTLITGTAGTPNDLVLWNIDGDAVDGPDPPTGTIVGTTDSQTLTAKTLGSGTAFDFGSDATGDIFYRNGSSTSRLARGSNTNLLTITNNLPAWDASGGGASDFLQLGNITAKTINTTGGISVTTTWNEVNPNSGTSDDLDTIAAGSDGDMIILRASTGDKITVRDGVGNIKTFNQTHSGQQDLIIDYDSMMTLVYDSQRSAWCMTGYSLNANEVNIEWCGFSANLSSELSTYTFNNVPIGTASSDRTVWFGITNPGAIDRTDYDLSFTYVDVDGTNAELYAPGIGCNRSLGNGGNYSVWYYKKISTGTTANVTISTGKQSNDFFGKGFQIFTVAVNNHVYDSSFVTDGLKVVTGPWETTFPMMSIFSCLTEPDLQLIDGFKTLTITGESANDGVTEHYAKVGTNGWTSNQYSWTNTNSDARFQCIFDQGTGNSGAYMDEKPWPITVTGWNQGDDLSVGRGTTMHMNTIFIR